MTRPEISGERNLEHSQWIKDKLPDSETFPHFWVTNQDWIHVIPKGGRQRIILYEEKAHEHQFIKKGKPRYWKECVRPYQVKIFSLLHRALEEYCKRKDYIYEYYGYHLLQLENTSAYNGKIWFDGNEITEEKLIKLLSMKEKPEKLTFFQ